MMGPPKALQQVQGTLNGVVQNMHGHDKLLDGWRAYLHDFHENHRVSYDAMVERVKTLENQVKVMEGTQTLQGDVDHKLGVQVEAGIAELERVKAIVETKTDEIDNVFVTETELGSC